MRDLGKTEAHKKATKGERRGERRGEEKGEEEEMGSGWRTLAQTHTKNAEKEVLHASFIRSAPNMMRFKKFV